MRLSTLLALSFTVGLSALAGCSVDTTSETTDDAVSEESALSGKGVPECMYMGEETEGWYWNKKSGSNKNPILIKYESCAGVQVACSERTEEQRVVHFVRADDHSRIVEESWDNKCSKYMKHIPICGANADDPEGSEGWYYQDSGKLISLDQCKDVAIACYAIGTRSESFVRADNGARIDWTRECSDLLRVAKRGANCGESINYTCEYNNVCFGIPDATKGGTGTCQTKGYCEDAGDCNRYMPNYAPPAYWACEEKQCVRYVHVNGPGEECGNVKGDFCVDGHECRDDANQPELQTCQPVAEEGEPCGSRGLAPCAAGLSCVFASPEDAATDKGGICKAE